MNGRSFPGMAFRFATTPLALVVLLAAPPPLWGQDPAAGETFDLRRADPTLAQARGHPDADVRVHLYRLVESRARQVLADDPDDTEARWWLVASLGLLADEVSTRERIGLAREIHDHAGALLEREPDHAGGHHAMARLQSGFLRLNRVTRYLAQRMLGNHPLQDATWEAAEHHITRAIEEEPRALVHRYEYARILNGQGRTEEALREVDRLLALPDRVPMDPVMRERALELRNDLSGGRR